MTSTTGNVEGMPYLAGTGAPSTLRTESGAH